MSKNQDKNVLTRFDAQGLDTTNENKYSFRFIVALK